MYSSSSATEFLDLSLDDGRRLQLVFKDLSRDALLETARATKPSFLYNPLREIRTYELVLPRHDLGTPTFYGAIVDPFRDRYWLFLEKVAGVELYQVGDVDVWNAVVCWLAALHDRFADDLQSLSTLPVPFVHFDADFFRLWAERAAAFAPVPLRAALEHIRASYEPVVDRLASLPRTFIHGEFYAPNVLVRHDERSGTVCPVDWEMAAIGTGLIDVAALTTGGWSSTDRASLEESYRVARRSLDLDERDFSEALDCCRLDGCLRWLGWAKAWSPPPQHAHDWAAEAMGLADRLGL